MPTPGFTAGDAKQENDPGGQNGTTLAMDTFPIWSLGQPPPKWASCYTVEEPLRRREAISYAVIIYSSLGMEEEAFTGVINIFGSQLCRGPAQRLSSYSALSYTHHNHLSDGLSKKAHRLIGDITQVDGSPFILQFISTPRHL